MDFVLPGTTREGDEDSRSLLNQRSNGLLADTSAQRGCDAVQEFGNVNIEIGDASSHQGEERQRRRARYDDDVGAIAIATDGNSTSGFSAPLGRPIAKASPVVSLECRLHCGQLGNPHWHDLCSRCFYMHALLPALASGPEAGDVLGDISEENQVLRHRQSSKIADAVDQAALFPVVPGQTCDLWFDVGTMCNNAALQVWPPRLVLSCITTLQTGILVFSIVVNAGIEPLTVNPWIGPSGKTLYLCGGLYILAGQHWRMLTAIFLHAGFLHFLPNAMFQWWFGCAVEAEWGSARTLEIYLASGIGGSLLSAALSSRKQLSVGASGALHGLLAARILACRGFPRGGFLDDCSLSVHSPIVWRSRMRRPPNSRWRMATIQLTTVKAGRKRLQHAYTCIPSGPDKQGIAFLGKSSFAINTSQLHSVGM